LLIFGAFSVCDGSFVLVSLIRSHGNDYFQSYSVLQCFKGFLSFFNFLIRLDKEKNQRIKGEKITGPQNIVNEIKQYQKKWLHHLQRMDTNTYLLHGAESFLKI
jgi:hypothetical protein